MKKILLLMACALSSLGFGQQLYFEGFESGFPGSMVTANVQGSIPWTGNCAGISTGGAPCPLSGSASATFFVNAFTSTTATLTTPTLNLSTGAFLLKFKHVQRNWEGDVNELMVRISTNGGANWTVMAHYINEVVNVTERVINLNQFALTANTQIQFAGINRWGRAIILDDIEVIANNAQNDVALNTLNLNNIILSGNQNIAGNVQNMGSNVVNSIDLKWQLDNGTVNTQNLTNLNLAPGQIFNYNHSTPWNAQPGMYSLKVWVDNVNNGTDPTPTNNEIIRTITVAMGQMPKTPLFEKFTANWCGPCANYVNNSFGPFFANNSQNITYVSYHSSESDGNTNASSQARAAYYQISGYPTQNINGRDIAPGMVPSATALNNNYNQALLEPSYFNMTSQYQITGTNMVGNINVMPLISGSYKIRVAVVENLTTLHQGSNGQTSFRHVLRRMAPNANGIDASFTHGVVQSFPFEVNLTGLAANQISNLSVVIFIQNDADKSVLQSTYAANTPLSNENFENVSVKLYPNPASETLYIQSPNAAKVAVIDITGKVLAQYNITEGTHSIPISRLTNGVYLIKIQGDNFEKIEKFVKN